MSRKKIIYLIMTEDYREYHKQKYQERLGRTKREDVKYTNKKYVWKDGNGTSVRYETLNRLQINNIIVSVLFTFRPVDDWDKMKELKATIVKTVNAWLASQSTYNDKNKIFIWDAPEPNEYIPKYQTIEFQVYLKRNTAPLSWKETLKEIQPFGELLYQVLKKTCGSLEIVLARRDTGALKKWVLDTPAPDTTEINGTVCG